MKNRIQTILYESQLSTVPGSNFYTDSVHMASSAVGIQHRERFYPRESSQYRDREQTGNPFVAAMIKECWPVGNDLSTSSSNSDFASNTIL